MLSSLTFMRMHVDVTWDPTPILVMLVRQILRKTVLDGKNNLIETATMRKTKLGKESTYRKEDFVTFYKIH